MCACTAKDNSELSGKVNVELSQVTRIENLRSDAHLLILFTLVTRTITYTHVTRANIHILHTRAHTNQTHTGSISKVSPLNLRGCAIFLGEYLICDLLCDFS